MNLKSVLLSVGIYLCFSCSNPATTEKQIPEESITKIIPEQIIEAPVEKKEMVECIVNTDTVLLYNNKPSGKIYNVADDYCKLTFVSNDLEKAFSVRIADFSKIKKSDVIQMAEKKTYIDFSNNFMTLPSSEAIFYIGMGGKLTITDVDKEKKMVSGTFETNIIKESKDGKDQGISKKVQSIKGAFYNCTYTEFK